MSQYYKVASTSEISSGRMKEYNVSGKLITIANTEGKYYAFNGLCTHEHCSLAGGYLDGLTLTCYCHGAQFEIKSGKVLAPPATEPLTVYKTKIEGEDLFVEL